MDMLLLFKFVSIAYFLGINVYGFILVNNQKKKNQSQDLTKRIDELLAIQEQEKKDLPPDKQTQPSTEHKKKTCKPANKICDGKLFFSGALGGALGIYTAMFIYKYKLTNFLLMVIMPVFIAINLYCLFIAFSGNFWINPQ